MLDLLSDSPAGGAAGRECNSKGRRTGSNRAAPLRAHAAALPLCRGADGRLHSRTSVGRRSSPKPAELSCRSTKLACSSSGSLLGDLNCTGSQQLLPKATWLLQKGKIAA